LNTEEKHQIEQKALNLTKAQKLNDKNWQINNTGTEQKSVFQEWLNCGHPVLARVKYLCDYRTDNCNPVCLNVNYEKSNVLTRASLPSQRAHKQPFEKICKSPHQH
jgi:hypothetical protein